MTKRTTTTPTTRRPRRVTTTTTTTDIAPAVAVVDAVPAPVPDAVVDAVPANDIDARIDAAFPNVDVPTFVRAMAHAFARVAGMEITSIDARSAVRDIIVAELVARMGDRAIPAGRTVGRFSNMHVFESQNSMYVAAAMSGAYVTDGHFVAAWRADLPNAKCDYIGRAFASGYPTSTLSDYLGNRHGIVPNVPDARDVVWAWHVAKRNRPTP